MSRSDIIGAVLVLSLVSIFYGALAVGATKSIMVAQSWSGGLPIFNGIAVLACIILIFANTIISTGVARTIPVTRG